MIGWWQWLALLAAGVGKVCVEEEVGVGGSVQSYLGSSVPFSSFLCETAQTDPQGLTCR